MPKTPAQTFTERIIADITAQITNGQLNEGDKIPSVTELAATYKCSIATARRAIERLQEDGVLQGHKGLGVFVGQAPH
ncbi:winged helix-turn-helix domain-containing protein [Phytohabitans sp. ZYX-F-186]|uniref:Winged helix-turn-helix domain-containing protein n=1 Tax=Phytohabitans maris TaxID=3071409 RepID=A0ABU0ZLV7_9ACTN|nr:winged helix-turn-helix domain-containing protein [Phytohabitans sp. ZYX-F-186]MDQ7907581.1 winged helix-turn-helix domain-containing protein [Phytohabitans sp. ZYX-F-186]